MAGRYGRFYLDGTPQQATHVAWLLRYGELPSLPIAPDCGDRLCCNPAHLSLIGDDLAARFWSKVAHGWAEVCWEWTGYRIETGYGQFGLNGKLELSHRVAWFLTHGELPELHVLHDCDNPPCCNPNHLFLGTQQDNMADRDAKDRQPRGERQGHAKLTESKVHEIRRSSESGPVLAKRFGVSARTISDVRHRKNWKHV